MFSDIVSGKFLNTGQEDIPVISEVWYTVAKTTVRNGGWDCPGGSERVTYEHHRLLLLANLDLLDERMISVGPMDDYVPGVGVIVSPGDREYLIGLKLMKVVEKNRGYNPGGMLCACPGGAVLSYWGNAWPPVEPIKLEYPLDDRKERAMAAYNVHCVLGDAAFCFCASQGGADILAELSDKFYARSLQILPLEEEV